MFQLKHAYSVAVLVQISIIMAKCAPSPTGATAPVIDIKWREEWGAREPKMVKALSVTPPPYVVIHHSATESCFSEASCKKLVKSFQNYHMDVKGWDDIAYNFIIGEDGNIYEGRGWGIRGSHSVNYNARSMGICLTGNFTGHLPNDKALQALQNLINYGVNGNKIASDYKLIGHRQASATECPGKTFYEALRKWEHWTPLPL